MKSAFYTTCDDQFSGWTKKLKSTSQSQTCTQKRSWSLFLVCCPSDPLQLSESWWNHCIWELCSANRWDTPKLQCLKSAMVNKMGAILHHNTQPHVTQPTLQKLNELGYKVLPLPPYSPDLLPIDYHFFKHLDYFLQGKHFHNHQSAENAFLAFIKSWNTEFL